MVERVPPPVEVDEGRRPMPGGAIGMLAIAAAIGGSQLVRLLPGDAVDVGLILVVVVLLVPVLLGVSLLVRRRRTARIRAHLATARPGAAVVEGTLSVEGAGTLSGLGHDLGANSQLGGAIVVVAATPDGLELWWRRRGDVRRLAAFGWAEARLVRVRTHVGLRRVPALAITPPADGGPRVPVIVTRGLGVRVDAGEAEAAIRRLEAARPRRPSA